MQHNINVEISQADLLQYLYELDSRFKTLPQFQFLEFIDANPWVIGNLLPVDDRKAVIVPAGTKTPDCRLTTSGLNHLINSFGMDTSFEGIPGDSPVKAFAVALQARHRTIHIDIDLNVFGQVPASTPVPMPIVAWVKKHASKALLVRGNRFRLSMVCDMGPSAVAFVQSFEHHKNKRIFCIGDVKSKIEVTYGISNNTLYGLHPKAGYYQQIPPTDNKLIPLTGTDVQELFDLLETHSFKSAGDGDIYSHSDRIEIVDAQHLLSPLKIAIGTYYKTLEAMGLEKKPIVLPLREFLNPGVKKIVDGKGFFNGKFYADSTDELPIGEGVRHYTYLNVGSNVNQLIELFEATGVEYDEDEPQLILDSLWRNTDDNDGHDYTYYDAQGDFGGYPIILFKESYLRALAGNVGGYIVANIIAMIPRNTTSLGKGLKQSLTEAKLAVDSLVTNDVAHNVEQSKILLEETSDIDFLDQLVSESENAVLINDDVLEEFTNNYQANNRLKNRVFDDDFSILHPAFRTIFEASPDFYKGISHSFVATLAAVTMPLFGYATVTNADYDGKIHSTVLSPYSILVGESATGKTRGLDLFSPLKYLSTTHFSAVRSSELEGFKSQFLDHTGTKFKDANAVAEDDFAIIDDDSDPDDIEYSHSPVLQLSRLKAEFTRQGVQPKNFLEARYPTFIDDASEAGVRNVFYDNQLAVNIRTITGTTATDIYPRPIGIISDEISILLSKIYSQNSHTFTPQYVCSRKEANDLTSTTSTQRSGSARRAGFTIAGAMTLSDFTKYLNREINESTTGFIPRFNLSILDSPHEDIVEDHNLRYPEISDDSSDSKISLLLCVYGIVIQSVSSDPDLFGDCPQIYKIFHGKSANLDIYSNVQTQMLMYKYYNHAKRLAENLKLKFPEDKFVKFIDSYFNKAYQELAIYSGCMAISYQFIDFALEVIKRTGKTQDELIAIAFGDKSGEKVSRSFYKLIKKEVNTLLLNNNEFIWNRDVTPKHMDIAGRLFMHSMSCMEFLLIRISNDEVGNLDVRAIKRQKELTIKRSGDKTFNLEKQITKVFDILLELNINHDKSKPFTISKQFAKRSRSVNRFYKDDLPTMVKIFDMLVSNGILIDLGANNRGGNNYMFSDNKNIMPAIRGIKSEFLKTVYEAGNDYED